MLFVVAFRLSLFSLHVFLMIYLFPTTHIHSKRESYLKCLTVSPPPSLSLSLSFYDDSRSLLFRRPSFVFFLLFSTLIDINEMKMCVCIYMCVRVFRMKTNQMVILYMRNISFFLKESSKQVKEGKKKKKEKTRNACVLLK